MTTILSVRLEPDLRRWAKRKADAAGVGTSEFVRQVIKDRRAAEKRKPFDFDEYCERLKRLPASEPGNFDRAPEL